MSSSSHAMPFSATEAICFSGGKRLNHLGKKSLLKAKKSSAKVVVRAIQTPKKPTATSGSSGESETTFSKNQTEEKEAYPFEKEYRDCACCWCRLYLLSTIVFSLSLGERERPYLFFRLFALSSVKSLGRSFFWSRLSAFFKPTMDLLLRVHDVKIFFEKATRDALRKY